MAQEKMKTQTSDELSLGGGGILFKEFIEENFKPSRPSLHDLMLEMVRKPSIVECLVTFSNHSSDENKFEDDDLDEGSCSDSEDLGEEVFSSLLLPRVVMPHVVVPRFCLPELEVPSDEEDSDDGTVSDIFGYVKHSSVSWV